MVQGLGVCIASFAIFITYIVFGLMSPRNKSKKVVLPPLGLLFCIIHYALELMMLYGFFETYIAKAAARSLWVLTTFGITGVFYLQNAGFMNNPEVIGRKISIAAYTALVSVVLFTFNAFASCIRKQGYIQDNFRFVELTEILIHVIVIGLLIFYRNQYSRKIFTLLLSSLLLYFFCWVSCILIYAFKIESHYYYVRELNPIAIATMVQICIQFFVFYNVVYGKFFENRINLEHSVISVSQSQIQPHFVNNVLYNIRELEHIECYLEIEMERFDNISVVYDIGVKDFSVPPLTLQPIVENSIQHGLRAKKSGGTITISTWKDEGKIYISVKDNGIDFDMIKPKDTKRKHLGIENTKFRIEKICNGTLDVKSIVNAGTEVLITIPVSNQ